MATRTGAALITYSQPNVYGRYFRCTKRTGAHLDWTKRELRELGKKHNKTYSLRIIQGCYNTEVEASAGTHDYDACLDVQITGMDWLESQRWLRAHGWAAWVRSPPEFDSYHVHMISLPPFKLQFVSKVGEWVPGQVDSYYNDESGLVGGAPDNTWHPENIRKTIFNYAKYLEELSVMQKIARVARRRAGLKRMYQQLVDRLKRLRK